MEQYAHSVAELDALRITRGGLFMDKCHTDELRRFALAYRALPRKKFETVSQKTAFINNDLIERKLALGDPLMRDVPLWFREGPRRRCYRHDSHLGHAPDRAPGTLTFLPPNELSFTVDFSSEADSRAVHTGAPADVRRDVRAAFSVWAPGGGWIAASDQVLTRAPEENVRVLRESCRREMGE